HDVEIVGEDPRPLLRSVDRTREQPQLVLQASVHLVPDADRLPQVEARGDDAIVGEVTDRPHVEDHDVIRQLLLCESGDAASLFGRSQAWIRSFMAYRTSVS